MPSAGTQQVGVQCCMAVPVATAELMAMCLAWSWAELWPGTFPASPGYDVKVSVGQRPLLTGCLDVAALCWWLGDFRLDWLAPALFNLLAVM